MEIVYKGIRLTLTQEQVNKIQQVEKEREEATKSFKKVLLYFGFKPVKDFKNGFEHPEGWWAEIIDHRNFKEVFMAGNGLPHSSVPPGGWHYGTPEEIKEQILKYWENKNQ